MVMSSPKTCRPYFSREGTIPWLTNIKKSYQTADFAQTALDGVSIAFRGNEFAAVLGPSGSGKTTMLNIIGGLDHYDSGDLEIDDVCGHGFGRG
jgi:ABC-type lipoprotein export system ATPase subunit